MHSKCDIYRVYGEAGASKRMGEKNRQSPDRRNDIAILQHFDTLNLLGTGRPKEAVGKGGEREEERNEINKRAGPMTCSFSCCAV